MSEPKADYWALYRELDKTIRAIQATEDKGEALSVFLRSLVAHYRHSLGIVAGRLYRREGEDYVLITMVEEPGSTMPARATPGYRIPGNYAMIGALQQLDLLIADRTDPTFDPAIEGPLAVETFAAITAGPGDDWIISFTLAPEARREHVLYSLSTIRHVINDKLRQFEVQDRMEQVQQIQRSMFPAQDPKFPGYDIYGRFRPIEEVGGDAYDFIPMGDRILGILVADSSGHGLVAALQARDVVTGMRMGIAEDLKIIRVIEKLNRVIHRSSLTSKFVSLFYGELERNGNFIYCNAGHVPTLLVGRAGFLPLTKGGPVLGPSPEARYERGYVELEVGDLLIFYSDGIVEAHARDDVEFGTQRLQDVVRLHRAASARAITDAIFAAVEEYAPEDPLRDDQTVVVVRRTAEID